MPHPLPHIKFNFFNLFFRIVTANLFQSFFIMGVGNFVYASLVLFQIDDKKYDQIFNSFRFMSSLGPACWRTAFVAIVLERTAATIFSKSYEKNAPILLGIVLYVIGVRFK